MRLQLFGSPTLHVGTRATPLGWQRPTALLAMVALHAPGLAREALAAQLLPEAPQAAARQNLRRSLHRARALLPDPSWLQADEQSLRWTGTCDAVDFQVAVEAGDWARALALQTAPLLAGCGSLGVAAIDDWLDAERARLQARLKLALTARLAQPSAADDERASCIARLADLDLLDEEALQSMLAAVCGPASRAAALAACDTGLRQLRQELGLDPTPRTLALLRQVSQGSAAAPAAAAAAAAEERRRGFAWVDGAAPLLGREDDLGALVQRLTDGPGRLFTLVGLGGVGKTRLALAAADAWAVRTGGRVVRVELAELSPGEDLAAAVALAAGLGQEGGATAPLADWLAQAAEMQPLLVLLDNFEHLLDDGDMRARPAQWIEAAPALRVLVTSREPLGLASEFRIELQGLLTRDGAPACVALFEHHARRLGAPARPADAVAIAAIARRLQGHPLGLELAASWSPLMPAAEILAEIERGLAFLADDEVAQDGHRSLRAVFARSWQRLPPHARQALSGLVVMEGSFDVAAARAVTSAPLAELLRLATQSLLQRTRAGRFALHPMVRQFAGRELDDTRRAALRERHAEHYASRVAALTGVGLGRVDLQAQAWLTEDASNLLAAWRHAVTAKRFDLVAAMQQRLGAFMTGPLRAETMARLWQRAEDALPVHDPLRQALALERAGALSNIGRIDESEALLDRIEPWLATPADRSRAATTRAVAASWRGGAAQAQRWITEAVASAEAADDPFLLARALQNQASYLSMVGRHAEAEAPALRMLALAQAHGANLFVARAERTLAIVRDELGRLDEAAGLLASALQRFDALGDQYELAFTTVNASHFARRRGDTAAQVRHAREALAMAERFGLLRLQLSALEVHGMALASEGRAAEAEATLARLLALALRSARPESMRRAVASLALVRAARGDAAALSALAWLQDQPGLNPALHDEMRRALARHRPDAAEREALAAAQAGTTLQGLCERMLAETRTHH